MVKLDVLDDAAIDAAAKRVKEEVGSLDVLINNAGWYVRVLSRLLALLAGITPPHGTTPMSFDREAVLKVLNVNLVSVAKMASVCYAVEAFCAMHCL